jgi:hypothetical protein
MEFNITQYSKTIQEKWPNMTKYLEYNLSDQEKQEFEWHYGIRFKYCNKCQIIHNTTGRHIYEPGKIKKHMWYKIDGKNLRHVYQLQPPNNERKIPGLTNRQTRKVRKWQYQNSIKLNKEFTFTCKHNKDN